MLHTVIFLSGGAILALELLASRIMTPYFGVSLYIWTGILSITLVSLALGYWAGGRYASSAHGRTYERLVQCYAMMPAVAALAIVAACLAYPHLFSPLAGWSLILGAFAACLILLFLPLVATSAMNPLLVAITLAHAALAASGRPALLLLDGVALLGLGIWGWRPGLALTGGALLAGAWEIVRTLWVEPRRRD